MDAAAEIDAVGIHAFQDRMCVFVIGSIETH